MKSHVENRRNAATVEIRHGCEQAGGWLVDIADFVPAPLFRGGIACLPSPTAGPCETVSALWRLPAKGRSRMMRPAVVVGTLPVMAW